MALHSDLHNVIASLAKFVSGSSKELRMNLSSDAKKFMYCQHWAISLLLKPLDNGRYR